MRDGRHLPCDCFEPAEGTSYPNQSRPHFVRLTSISLLKAIIRAPPLVMAHYHYHHPATYDYDYEPTDRNVLPFFQPRPVTYHYKVTYVPSNVPYGAKPWQSARAPMAYPDCYTPPYAAPVRRSYHYNGHDVPLRPPKPADGRGGYGQPRTRTRRQTRRGPRRARKKARMPIKKELSSQTFTTTPNLLSALPDFAPVLPQLPEYPAVAIGASMSDEYRKRKRGFTQEHEAWRPAKRTRLMGKLCLFLEELACQHAKGACQELTPQQDPTPYQSLTLQHGLVSQHPVASQYGFAPHQTPVSQYGQAAHLRLTPYGYMTTRFNDLNLRSPAWPYVRAAALRIAPS